MLEPLERLRNAIKLGNLPITKRLLHRFPELWLNRDSENKGWSNLHYASYHGNYLICFHLVSFINKNLGNIQKHYSKIDLLTFNELTIIHLPLIHHHSQTLHYLLQEFPGELWLNHPGGDLKQTPLHYACIYGFKEGIKLLLEFGAAWDATDLNGNTCLHLCFQYGNFDCIQDLLKFVLVCCKDRDEGLEVIEKFESIRNEKGWLAIDYAFSFELIKQYRFLKQELFVLNQELSGSMQSNSEFTRSSSSFNLSKEPSQTSLQENKVLSSPIIPMSQSQSQSQPQAQQDQQQNNKDVNDNPQTSKTVSIKNRAHSQSLPNADPVIDIQTNRNKSISTRRRSNTLYNYRPPNPINASSPRNSTGGPHTPITTQTALNNTPSLKSVTISPLVRSNGNENSSSPQSVISISSAINASPSHSAIRRKSMNSMAIIPLSYQNNDDRDQRRPSYSGSIDARTSVMDRTPNKSDSTPSPSKQLPDIVRLPRRSSSTMSIGAKLATDDYGTSNPDQEDANISAPTITNEAIPMLRKAKSSTTDLNSTLSRQKSTILPSPEVESDNLKRSNISSISFSRVR